MKEDMDPQVVDIPELEVFHLVLNLIDDYCLCLDYFRQDWILNHPAFWRRKFTQGLAILRST